MSDSFRQAYAKLTDFIAGHSEIEIGESVTSIPENVRHDFYSLFNEARSAFVEEKFPEYLANAVSLRREYDQIKEESKDWLLLEDISIISKLRRFMRNPGDSLTRELFDLLFDLLKKRETTDSFEKKASIEINSFYPSMYRGGYEKWAVLSLANLLGVQKAFRVPVRELQPGDRAKSAAYAPMEEVPAPVESASFLFSQPPKAIFAVPDFVIQSSHLNRFVGIRSEFKEGIYRSLNASHERDWIPLDTDLLILLESGLTLIYLAEKIESVMLVADVAKVCRPDLVLFCVDSRTMTQKAALDSMAIVEDKLRPVRGSFVIVNDSWPESDEPSELPAPNPQTGEDLPEVRLLTVGLDRSKLQPVIDALRDVGDSATPT